MKHGFDGSLGIVVRHAKPMRHAGAKGLVVHVRQVEDAVDLGHAFTEVLGELRFELSHVGERHSLFYRSDDGDGESLCFVALASELLRNLVDELHGVMEGVQSMCQTPALPLLGYADVVRAVPVNVALFAHLLFGLATGVVFLPFQRPYIARSPELA